MSAVARRMEAPRKRTASEVVASPEFQALVRRRWLVSTTLLALLFGTYYGYILLIPFARSFMVARIGEATTRAIPIGAAVIVVSFVLTWIYVGWANRRYDPEVERLRRELAS